jgi:hypothetical protein
VLIATVLENPGRPVTAEKAMPESEEAAVAAARLEAALDRIARRAADAAAEGPRRGADAEAAPDPRLAELTTKLDTLIASLREVLARPG